MSAVEIEAKCPPSDPPSDVYEVHRARASERRKCLSVERPEGAENSDWALSLSGGGIRSATFNLGVLQALAKVKVPGPNTVATPPFLARGSMLTHFDFLSTVSGGGYIGAFFGSLFRVGRAEPAPNANPDAVTAGRAYDTLLVDPPGRIRGNGTSAVSPAASDASQNAMAWLRENGRYLAPSGSGDYGYAVALTIRNFVATHYVLGSVIVLAFALIASIQGILALHFTQLPDVLLSLYPTGCESQREVREIDMSCDWIWWSPLCLVSVTILALWVVPLGLAFWQAHPSSGKTPADRACPASPAALSILFVALTLGCFVAWQWGMTPGNWSALAILIAYASLISFLSVAQYACTAICSTSIAKVRVVLTRHLAGALVLVCLISFVAAIDTLAQTLYFKSMGLGPSVIAPTGASAVLVWGVRGLTRTFAEKDRTGPFKKMPLEVVMLLAGSFLVGTILLLWKLFFLWVLWQGGEPHSDLMKDPGAAYYRAAYWTTGLMTCLTLLTARFPNFVNLSTLQSMYSARLTRAYLGATNRERFESSDPAARSAAEPMPRDHITPEDYYENPAMPLHLINVCVNQNVDPSEQLVQRDRKGKLLVIYPGGCSLDGQHGNLSAFKGPATAPGANPGANTVVPASSEMNVPLTIGEWIGVSGAAVSTGMGRGSGIGFSLTLGLANVRLGRWWKSGIKSSSGTKDPWYVTAFLAQSLLIGEIRGRFHGTRRTYQYLSDGGHFDNTGLYELLRPERRISLIVVADCGADPRYEFGDLATAIRLARIDFGVEVALEPSALQDPLLSRRFGTESQIREDALGLTPGAACTRCAMLLNAYHRGDVVGKDPPRVRIVVLKPAFIDGLPPDLNQYRSLNVTYPQQPTGDQFYDEAQWESYRRIGLEICSRVFGHGESSGYVGALWKLLLK